MAERDQFTVSTSYWHKLERWPDTVRPLSALLQAARGPARLRDFAA